MRPYLLSPRRKVKNGLGMMCRSVGEHWERMCEAPGVKPQYCNQSKWYPVPVLGCKNNWNVDECHFPCNSHLLCLILHSLVCPIPLPVTDVSIYPSISIYSSIIYLSYLSIHLPIIYFSTSNAYVCVHVHHVHTAEDRYQSPWSCSYRQLWASDMGTGL